MEETKNPTETDATDYEELWKCIEWARDPKNIEQFLYPPLIDDPETVERYKASAKQPRKISTRFEPWLATIDDKLKAVLLAEFEKKKDRKRRNKEGIPLRKLSQQLGLPFVRVSAYFKVWRKSSGSGVAPVR